MQAVPQGMQAIIPASQNESISIRTNKNPQLNDTVCNKSTIIPEHYSDDSIIDLHFISILELCIKFPQKISFLKEKVWIIFTIG